MAHNKGRKQINLTTINPKNPNYFTELFNQQLYKLTAIQDKYSRFQELSDDEDKAFLKFDLELSENSPFLINFNLSIALLYANKSGNKDLKYQIKQTLANLNKVELLKNRFFILAATHPHTKQLLIAAKKLVELELANYGNLHFNEKSCQQNFRDAFSDLSEKAIKLAAIEKFDIQPITSPRAKRKNVAKSSHKSQPKQPNSSSANSDTVEVINKKIAVIRNESSKALNKIIEANNNAFTASFEKMVKHPWRVKLEKTWVPRFIRNRWQGKAKVALTDALVGFYKLKKHEAIIELYSSRTATSNESMPLLTTAMDKADVLKELFDLFLLTQDESVNAKRTKVIKQLKKSLNSVAEEFGYNFELSQNARGKYDKIPKKGQKANLFLAQLGIRVSERYLRRSAKTVARAIAITIALVVALGTAASIFAAVVALTVPAAFVPVLFPLAIGLFIASFAANYFLFKDSIYNVLNQFFIKRDIFKNLTPGKTIVLIALTACAVLSSLAVGAITFSGMATLCASFLGLVGLAAACPPVLITVVAGAVAIATALATAALLFTTATNLIKQDYHLKVINFFKDILNDINAAYKANEKVKVAANVIKLLSVPVLAVMGGAVIIIATYAISSSLFASTTKFINNIPQLVNISFGLKGFLTQVGPLIAGSCVFATAGIRLAFIGRNITDLNMGIANSVKTTSENRFNKIAEYKQNGFLKTVKQDISNLLPTKEGIKNFFSAFIKNPYLLTGIISHVKTILGQGLVLLNAGGNMALFHGGRTHMEHVLPHTNVVEGISSGISSFAANRTSMHEATAEVAPHNPKKEDKRKFSVTIIGAVIPSISPKPIAERYEAKKNSSEYLNEHQEPRLTHRSSYLIFSPENNHTSESPAVPTQDQTPTTNQLEY